MKNFSKIIAAFVMALMLTGLLGNNTVAFAATVSEIEAYEDWSSELNSWAAAVSGTGTYSDAVYNIDASADGAVSTTDIINAVKTDRTEFNDIRDDFKEYLISIGAKTISKSDQVANKISAITDKVGIEADLEGGSAWLSEESIDLISQIIGFLTVLVLMAVGLFTAIDIMFLTIPPLHAALEEKAAASGKTDKAGNPKPRLVSTDACAAWHEATETGKNVLLIYLKKRAIAYVAIAIVVYMLLSGNLTAIITLVLKLISGALDAVEKLA